MSDTARTHTHMILKPKNIEPFSVGKDNHSTIMHT